MQLIHGGRFNHQPWYNTPQKLMVAVQTNIRTYKSLRNLSNKKTSKAIMLSNANRQSSNPLCADNKKGQRSLEVS